MALELMDELAARDILGGSFSTAPSMYPETHFLSFITLHLSCCTSPDEVEESMLQQMQAPRDPPLARILRKSCR